MTEKNKQGKEKPSGGEKNAQWWEVQKDPNREQLVPKWRRQQRPRTNGPRH